MSNNIRRVAILGGNRIPFARSNTVYAHDSPTRICWWPRCKAWSTATTCMASAWASSLRAR